MRGLLSRRSSALFVVTALLGAAAVGTFFLRSEGDGELDGEPSVEPAVAEAQLLGLIAALCEVRDHAIAGERTRAAGIFWNRAHQGLHVLNASLVSKDRALASALLRAKATVEGDISAFSPTLAGDVEPLIEISRRSLKAIGREDPGPCVTGPNRVEPNTSP